MYNPSRVWYTETQVRPAPRLAPGDADRSVAKRKLIVAGCSRFSSA